MKLLKTGIALAIAAALSGCGGGSSSSSSPSSSGSTTSSVAQIAVPSSVLAVSGYTVSVFAQAPGKSSTPPTCAATSPNCFTKPDSMVQMGTGATSSLYIGYGDGVQPTGGISATNTAVGNVQIVQYDMSGNQGKVYTVPGHNDGMMVYDSHTIWAMSNEDGNPMLSVIDTNAGTVTTYSADATPVHGGGLDDMQLIGGQVFVAAFAPALNTTTNLYDQPALYTIALNANASTFHLTPVMSGNATAHVINPSAAGVSVDASGNAVLGNPLVPNGSTNNPGGLQDPDSMAIDPSGNLVLDSQADSELVFISNPGTANQSVKELFLTLYTNPWPVDDTRWAPSSSQFMLVTDTGAGLIYKVQLAPGFTAGNMYSAGQGTILLDDPTTGNMTPIVTGMNSPHGMLFVQ